MTKRIEKMELDIEQGYPAKQFVTKLRRLADCIEQNKTFRIQVAGERITVPPDVIMSIEHEREAGIEEVEFQIKWPIAKQ